MTGGDLHETADTVSVLSLCKFGNLNEPTQNAAGLQVLRWLTNNGRGQELLFIPQVKNYRTSQRLSGGRMYSKENSSLLELTSRLDIYTAIRKIIG